MYKICNKCKVGKSIKDFHKNKSRKDGHVSECKECCNYRTSQWRKDNPDKDLLWRNNNKDKVDLYHKKWMAKNPDIVRSIKAKHIRNKRRNNALFNLKHTISNLVYISTVKCGYTKKSRTYEILGCSYEEFRDYIENKFLEGMSWDNRSEWHLDHIKPISLATNEEEVIALNHYTNFQPLWASDNRKKGNIYTDNNHK